MVLHQAPSQSGGATRERVPLLHRVPSAAAAAAPAQVPGRARDRRRQLPVGHFARGVGGRAAGAARRAPRRARQPRRKPRHERQRQHDDGRRRRSGAGRRARLDRGARRLLRRRAGPCCSRARPAGSTSWAASPTTRDRWCWSCRSRSRPGSPCRRRTRPTLVIESSDAGARGNDTRHHPARGHRPRRAAAVRRGARAAVARSASGRWAAYVAGALVVLQHEHRHRPRHGAQGPGPIRRADRQGRQLVGGARGRRVRGAGGARRRGDRRPRARARRAEGREPRRGRALRRDGSDDGGVRPARPPARAALPAGRGGRPRRASAARWSCSASTRASGHAVSGADYGSVRAAAFMGYRIVADAAGLAARAVAPGRVAIDDPRVRRLPGERHAGRMARATFATPSRKR